jgi:multidrug efflux system outer membrane protein
MGHRRSLEVLCLFGALAVAKLAHAGPFDLEQRLDDDEKPAEKKESVYGEAKAPTITIRRRTYTLEECLALTDRNHPNLWAARARLSAFHAQLEEVTWLPYWQWNASVNAGVIPTFGGTALYNSAPYTRLNTSFTDGLGPFFQVGVSGVVPLYTFGKIEWSKRATEAQVRVGEWDVEKNRQQVRMDVRRAYFGAMLARDARYLIREVLDKLDKAVEGVRKKQREGDQSVDDIDRLRLELQRDEVRARSSEPDKGEIYAMAALRFMTGVQTDFDIPDEPLKRAEVFVAPLTSYLSAARLFRPEVNQARAGIAGRRAELELAKARLFPDVGLGLGASYNVAPTVTQQNNAWVIDPFNRFGFAFGLGARWSLDLMPAQARIAGAAARLEEVRSLERMALGGTAVEVENAYGVMLEARKREESWAAAEHKSKSWIVSTQDAIDIGSKDEKFLLEPLRYYISARLGHMYALMDYNVALSDLARVSGWDSAAPVK